LRAVDKAYSAVRSGIIEGRYEPNARITEQEVAAAAGVSRTPAREALRRLHAEGLVIFTPNVGAVIAQWTQADADEIFDLRVLLESYAAAQAARLIAGDVIDQMRISAEAQLVEARERSDGYLERISVLNSQFHRLLLSAANSPRLEQALAALLEAPLIMKTFRRYSVDSLERSALHHLELVQAFEARDADWAASVMRSHILAAKVAIKPSSR
jgi:DNA-binding GntR family transcriptional regulator